MITSLTWLTVKTFFKKAWAWCKKYWQLLVGIAIPILAMIIFRRSGDISKVLQTASDSHQKEVDAIDKSYKEEIRKREEALRKYEETIALIEEKYKEENKTLEGKKKKEIKKILERSEEDPEEITRRISEITGFSIR
jgi:Fe2+ transport system protein B